MRDQERTEKAAGSMCLDGGGRRARAGRGMRGRSGPSRRLGPHQGRRQGSLRQVRGRVPVVRQRRRGAPVAPRRRVLRHLRARGRGPPGELSRARGDRGRGSLGPPRQLVHPGLRGPGGLRRHRLVQAGRRPPLRRVVAGGRPHVRARRHRGARTRRPARRSGRHRHRRGQVQEGTALSHGRL